MLNEINHHRKANISFQLYADYKNLEHIGAESRIILLSRGWEQYQKCREYWSIGKKFISDSYS